MEIIFPRRGSEEISQLTIHRSQGVVKGKIKGGDMGKIRGREVGKLRGNEER